MNSPGDLENGDRWAAPAICREVRRLLAPLGPGSAPRLVDDASLAGPVGRPAVEHWICWDVLQAARGEPTSVAVARAVAARAIARDLAADDAAGVIAPTDDSRAFYAAALPHVPVLVAAGFDRRRFGVVYVVDAEQPWGPSPGAAFRAFGHALTRARRRLVLAANWPIGAVRTTRSPRSAIDLLIRRGGGPPDARGFHDDGGVRHYDDADGVRWVVLSA